MSCHSSDFGHQASPDLFALKRLELLALPDSPGTGLLLEFPEFVPQVLVQLLMPMLSFLPHLIYSTPPPPDICVLAVCLTGINGKRLGGKAFMVLHTPGK